MRDQTDKLSKILKTLFPSILHLLLDWRLLFTDLDNDIVVLRLLSLFGLLFLLGCLLLFLFLLLVRLSLFLKGLLEGFRLDLD